MKNLPGARNPGYPTAQPCQKIMLSESITDATRIAPLFNLPDIPARSCRVCTRDSSPRISRKLLEYLKGGGGNRAPRAHAPRPHRSSPRRQATSNSPRTCIDQPLITGVPDIKNQSKWHRSFRKNVETLIRIVVLARMSS